MIDIYLYGGECTIWEPKDIYECRVKYRLLGGLIGTYFVNNKINGDVNSIPLILSNYEVTLGIEKGWFRLIKLSSQFPNPLPTDIEQLFNERNIRSKELIEKKLVESKKREIEFRKLNNNNDNTISTNITVKDQEKIQQTQQNAGVNIYNSINDSLEKEPVFKKWKDNFMQQSEIYKGWEFPKTEKEKLLYQVYKDLWEKGYFISGGSKFGGHFLAYKGDPFLFHSTFIVIAREYEQEFTSLDLITFTRLSVNVNKTILLASIDKNDTNKIIYISVKWKGVT